MLRLQNREKNVRKVKNNFICLIDFGCPTKFVRRKGFGKLVYDILIANAVELVYMSPLVELLQLQNSSL